MPRSTALRTLTALGFAIHLALLVWTILWKLDIPSVGAAAGLPRPWKIVPFVASGGAGASDPLEVLANVLLFLPFGVYLGLLAPRWRWGRVALVTAATSLALEIAQHLLSTGSFDTTDVIANTAGGAAGLGILLVVRRMLRGRADRTVARATLAVTAFVLVTAMVYVVSPLHAPQQQDVVVAVR